MSTQLAEMHDGDRYPVLRFKLYDDGVVRDTTNVAAEAYIYTADGTRRSRRACNLVSPKADGIVECWLRGNEADFDGAGGDLYVYLRQYIPVAPDGTSGASVTNLLVNPSFEAFTGATNSRVPDSWTLVGAKTTEEFNEQVTGDTFPAPATISGSAFDIYNGGIVTAYFSQEVVEAVTAGDTYSFGMWWRGIDLNAASSSATFAMVLRGDVSGSKTITYIQVTGAYQDLDWVFYYGALRFNADQASLFVDLKHGNNAGTGSGCRVRYDEACLFEGTYRVTTSQPYRVRVLPRVRPKKRPTTLPSTGNLIAGIGGFEYDSDADGVADGWYQSGSLYAKATLTHNTKSANVRSGSRGSQQIELTSAAAAGDRISCIATGRFLSGEVYRFSVYVKTDSALSDGVYLACSTLAPQDNGISMLAVPATKGTTFASFTQITEDITLLSDCADILLQVSFGTSTAGPIVWLDDASLVRQS